MFIKRIPFRNTSLCKDCAESTVGRWVDKRMAGNELFQFGIANKLYRLEQHIDF